MVAIREVESKRQILIITDRRWTVARSTLNATRSSFDTLTEYRVGGALNERFTRASSEEENFKWIRQIAAALPFPPHAQCISTRLASHAEVLRASELGHSPQRYIWK